MSEAWRGAKMDTGKPVEGNSSLDNVEVAEAIKALQTQLADLRRIVQAAKAPNGTTIVSGRRQ